ncbi:hypothetical protein BDV29DRAFT_193450 [Aspergillus leporis]|uniref:Uncharacterized protein n=1 Tax=Aspergillus leporis TaxID=41062 RepID=A0A5N5WRR4_9EURO|nr:hypothetical protein BDV29DRAFT_193450 [Aspergillus leporis]
MGSPSTYSPYINHKSKDLRRLYEPLSLLRALNDQITEKQPIEVVDSRGVGILQRRRDFLNALVRLGAFKEGCNLAITAGKDDENVIIAVAGSEAVNDDVVPFLETLLELATKGPHEGSKREPRQMELLQMAAYVMKWHNNKTFALYHEIFDYLAPVCIPVVIARLQEPGVFIAHRMFSDTERANQLRRGLDLVVPSPRRLTEQLKYYQETVLTRVHPELRVVDFFDKNNRLVFFDDRDKYIASSKPCCYLCSQYLSHRRNYYIRESDPNDIDLQWRIPDILDVESNIRLKEQNMILRKITERIRTDAERFILSRWPPSDESSINDDSSQSLSFSNETADTYGCFSHCRIPASPGAVHGKHPSAKRWYDNIDEDDEDIVVFRGRPGH